MNSFNDFFAYTADRFESFFKQRLCYRAEQDPRERDSQCDFRYLDVPIPFGDSYLDSLVNLYSRLPESAKEQYHGGLVGLFRHSTRDEFSIQGMSDLIYLIGMTRCFPGIVAFASVLGTGAWGERYPGLIYDALSVIQIFPLSDKAYRAAKDLATSVNFQHKYVFDVYTAMISSHPQNWLEDLKMLAARFARLFDDIERIGSAEINEKLRSREQRLAEQMSKRIPLNSLAAGLNGLNPSEPIEARLLQRLLGATGPLALAINKEGKYELVDRQESARCVSIVVEACLLTASFKWKLIDDPRMAWLNVYKNLGSVYLKNCSDMLNVDMLKVRQKLERICIPHKPAQESMLDAA